MDGERFDQLTRGFASGTSRRTVLKGLLGLGGTAAISAVLTSETDARRSSSSSTPTTAPPPTTPPPSPCQGFPCGFECCDAELQCCDGECCATGYECLSQHFPGSPLAPEETCCRADLVCDTDSTKCCADGERCCNRDGVSYCIPEDGCCNASECPDDIPCREATCPIGDWTCQSVPLPDTTPCNDGDPCTEGDTCQNGVCVPGPEKDCSGLIVGGGCFTPVGCAPVDGTCILEYVGDGVECPTGVCYEGDCCTPATCPSGICSSSFPDNCGGTIDCSGNCGTGSECRNDRCCVPDDGPCNLNNPGACCSLACQSLSGGTDGKCIPS